MAYKTICAVGDSITNGYWDETGQGWFGRLAEQISSKYPFAYGYNNISQTGDRTIDAFHRLAAEGFSRHFDILLIAVGVNDLIRSPNVDSPCDMSEHLRIYCWNKLLDLAQKSGAEIMVMDMLPVCEAVEVDFGTSPLHFRNDDIRNYNAILEKICQERNIRFFKRHDIWAKRDLKQYYKDTAHPNALGHKLLCDEIFGEMIAAKLI